MQEDFQAKWLMMTAEVERGTRKDSHKLSSRAEDPAWFQDISSSARTKEEVMFRSCSARVRGYLTRAEQQLGENPCSRAEALCLATVVGNSLLLQWLSLIYLNLINIQHFPDIHQCKAPSLLTSVLPGEFRARLKAARYHGSYFDRGAAAGERLCDGTGQFCCQGRYDRPDCEYRGQHTINPYSSREARLLFSTWNLDHQVERSRAVVPALLEAARTRRNRQQVNSDYFYSLLFTRDNLKLVHVVCHDKQEHDGRTVDKNKYFVQ